MNRIISKSFKHLKHIYKPYIRVEKKVTIEKFHRFVVLENQYYWIYQDPAAEDIKLSKVTSKKERKYGNLQFPESNDDNNSSDQ